MRPTHRLWNSNSFSGMPRSARLKPAVASVTGTPVQIAADEVLGSLSKTPLLGARDALVFQQSCNIRVAARGLQS